MKPTDAINSTIGYGKTKPTREPADPAITDAVAVVCGGGFFHESAPTYKPRGKPRMILLTYEQRMAIERPFGYYNPRELIGRYDREYQGKFPGALPQGYLTVDKDFSRANTWGNAESQWVVAAELWDFLSSRIDKAEADEFSNRAMNIFTLVKLASE